MSTREFQREAERYRPRGTQEGRFFHGYWFLPLYVFGGEQSLVSTQRSTNVDGAKYAGTILNVRVRRLTCSGSLTMA